MRASREPASFSPSAFGLRGSRLFGPSLLVFILFAVAVAPASEVYFSPNGGIRQRLVRAIQESRQSIDLATYTLTARELIEALAAASARGVRIRVLMDREKAEEGGPGIRALRGSGVPVRSLGVPELSLMHHKFAIFDGRLVLTGSYNWTHSAEVANYENVVLLDDPGVVNRFQEEFRRLWRASRD